MVPSKTDTVGEKRGVREEEGDDDDDDTPPPAPSLDVVGEGKATVGVPPPAGLYV